MHQIFARAVAHEGHAVGFAFGIYSQAFVEATQFTAGLAPNTLIQQLDHHEIGFVMLSLIAKMKIGAAEILQIGHNEPQQATRLEDSPALLQERSNLITGNVFQEVGGIDQLGGSVFERQAGEKVGALHRRAVAGVIQIDPSGVCYKDTSAGEIDVH
jgi:hypothetical protein